MRILRWVCTFLTVSGCLPSSSWTYPYKKFLFNAYTVIVLLLVHSLIISQILDIAFNIDNQDDFSDNFYVSMPMIITSFKLCSLLVSQGNIEILINALQEEPFLPMNTEEIEIQMRFNKLAEWNAIGYFILVGICVVWMSLTSYFANFKSKTLKFRAWLPYDYSSPVSFNFTYLYQVVTITISSLVNVACDTLFCGLLIHAYSQFEIFRHRLQNINRNRDNLVKQCARHHSHIYKFAAMVNKEFTLIVFVQFVGSTALLCFDLFRLTQQNLGSKFTETVLYVMCTSMQILYYCWFGNEVKLKSFEIPDMVFSSNWVSLSNNTKRILLMIMRRATIPVEITSGYMVPMNLESFKTLLKSSYSAYNVL